ncbi:competence protein ComEC [Litorimonas cladophorae]|uniref:Competence protein ComEC n=1 Tax=Litorimonas cladophorae TaxID=1220491 RepID=A0A918KDS0_9PROT|nr:competence protein ComEC [Litorimonas cladophorae]
MSQALETVDSSIGFNSGIIAFGVGIAAYFAWSGEPSSTVIAGMLSLAAFMWWIFDRKGWQGLSLVWIILLVLLGLGRASWHTTIADAPRLPAVERTYRIEGWVSAIEKSGKSERYVVETHKVRGLTAERMPERLRIRITKKPEPPIVAGDTINWLVAARAPPSAVVPSGYDSGQVAYFRQIGGFGFGYGAPQRQADVDLPPLDSLRRAVVRWRYHIADRVMAAAPPKTAGLQAALMTGVRRFIPTEQTENLRIAGLAHILAISGLHMALLAGGTYSAITFVLACILPLSRRYDVRKFAAVTAIGAATFYLVLSGASVATQRAWVMSTIFFLAIVLDRRAISMRSVSVAALITLALHPESLISVGFQMSFAAVVALVATYQAWQTMRPAFTQRSISRKMVDFFASLSVTSLVAGFATGAFALFHFNRIAQYGFAGNLLAMPLFSLFVMPLAVLSLLTMPFGLEGLPLQLMGLALEPILKAAEWVAGWPGAMAYIGAAPNWVLPLFSLGFVAVCMGQKWVRLLGLGAILLAFLGWNTASTPDLRISDSAKVAFWQPPESGTGDPVLMVGSRRPDRYGREQFAQRAGLNDVDWAPYTDRIAQCDALACRAKIGAWQISILQNPSEVPEECEASDLVILAVRSAGPVARRNCSAVLVDESTLRETGALDVYLKDHLTIKAARPSEEKRRPWH